MVNVKKDNSWEVRSLEARLSDKFDALLVAREEKNATAFDEFSKSIETLLIAVPDANKKLKSEKEGMILDLQQQYQEIEQRMNNATDSISRDSIGQRLTQEVDWAFREEYSVLLMEIFSQYNLVPTLFIEKTTVQPQVRPEPKQEKEEKEEPKKKPKLLKKNKETKFKA